LATPPELAKRLARVRQLTDEYKAGDKRSFDAVRNLADFLLRLTVLKPSGGVRLASIQGPTKRFVAGGWNGPDDPLPLNDGKYLRLAITLELVETKDGPRLKVFESSIQYQADRDGKDWIFRYDYLRYSPNPHPFPDFARFPRSNYSFVGPGIRRQVQRGFRSLATRVSGERKTFL